MNSYSIILGNKPPATVPAKGAYMLKDVERLQNFYGIPVKPPAVSFLINQLYSTTPFTCNPTFISCYNPQ